MAFTAAVEVAWGALGAVAALLAAGKACLEEGQVMPHDSEVAIEKGMAVPERVVGRIRPASASRS
jgi:hypothetical protein